MEQNQRDESAIRHPLRRLHDIERKVPRTIVRIEKKIIDFPFRKYFIGHKKTEPARFKPDWRSWKNDKLTMAWLGQATVLINFYGTWILTDPVFSKRCGIGVGPVTLGPRRLVDVPLTLEELPPIDLLLISHAHMDHTDPPSLQRLTKAKHVIVATNTMGVYKEFKFADARELDWREKLIFDDLGALSVEAIEVRHAGWRMPWDPCRSRKEKNGFSYNGYLVEKRDKEGELHAFVFTGDTGYIKTFQTLGDRMRAEGREIECTIIPIGTYNPWVEAHCNPEQAWRMTCEMNSRVIVPIHWNTFVQSSEPRNEPMEWLQSIVDFDDQIALTDHGQTWECDA